MTRSRKKADTSRILNCPETDGHHKTNEQGRTTADQISKTGLDPNGREDEVTQQCITGTKLKAISIPAKLWTWVWRRTSSRPPETGLAMDCLRRNGSSRLSLLPMDRTRNPNVMDIRGVSSIGWFLLGLVSSTHGAICRPLRRQGKVVLRNVCPRDPIDPTKSPHRVVRAFRFS